MRIGYAKIGRAWEPRLDHASTVGGDVDVIRALWRLMDLRPRDRFVLVGKTRVDPRAVFGAVNITAPWYEDQHLHDVRRAPVDDQMNAIEKYAQNLDALVIWLGQIGGAASALPKLDGSGPIQPLQMDVNYAAYLCRLVNVWRDRHPDRDVVWLVPDPRNRLALHDFRRPPSEPLLAQYDMTRNGVHYDPTPTDPMNFVRAVHRFEYAAVELCAIPAPDQWPDVDGLPAFADRAPFGLVANENKRGKNDRSRILTEWVPDLDQIPLYGKWSVEGTKELGRSEPIPSVPYEDMMRTARQWKATLTLPASGSGWATSKPWEMFAAGVVCFFHPAYDDQGHVIPLRPSDAKTPDEALLSLWLRPKTAEEFQRTLKVVASDHKLHGALVRSQRAHLTKRYAEELGGVRAAMRRLDQIQGGM